MANNIGHASIAETGGINGTPGDSTGKEVCIRTFYEKGWTHVMRPIHAKVRDKLVNAMNNACNNDLIGYGQYKWGGIANSGRLGLYNELERIRKYLGDYQIYPKHIKQLRTKVNCDCSSLIAVCCLCAGLKVNPGITTYNEVAALSATDEFQTIKYVSGMELKKGDILVSSGHTAMVLTDNGEKTAPLNASSVDGKQPVKETVAKHPALQFDSYLAGVYIVDVSDYLVLRDGAGVGYDELFRLPPDAAVHCYGYHTGDWLYIQYVTGGTQYVGFSHKQYLEPAKSNS